jgi:hypothetical protein
MELASPTQTNRNFSLDSPPPQPPASVNGGGGFMAPPPSSAGYGDMANSPTLMTMQGLAMVKDGCQLIANGLPELSQILSNTITDFEQLITQSMAAKVAGQQPAVAAPPGVAPMMMPPPGAAPPSPASPAGMGGSGGPFSAA